MGIDKRTSVRHSFYYFRYLTSRHMLLVFFLNGFGCDRLHVAAKWQSLHLVQDQHITANHRLGSHTTKSLGSQD